MTPTPYFMGIRYSIALSGQVKIFEIPLTSQVGYFLYYTYRLENILTNTLLSDKHYQIFYSAEFCSKI